jgi:enoyl-CoA hydratase/carnithine racemase
VPSVELQDETCQVVTFERRGAVAIITLRRPEARNAVNGALAQQLEAAIDRLEDEDGCWVGVLTHEGPVFSAGADLKEVAAGRGGELATARGGFGGFVNRDRRKPVLAAVDGAALGGGCEFALACDLVVATTQSRFGLPEVKVGQLAAAGGLIRLPRVLPRSLAMRMALTGEPIDAGTALAHGLVVEVVEPGRAVDAAVALAERIAANAPLSVQASRRVVLETAGLAESEAWKVSGLATREVTRSQDAKEGPRAFAEKRRPVWTGA